MSGVDTALGRERAGMANGLIPPSVGIADGADLLAALESALADA